MSKRTRISKVEKWVKEGRGVPAKYSSSLAK
ncbi:hypothetical protein JOD21_001163 [Jeotgalibacillus terrae]|nr:hypothetical protein [Jeotgalibacillus terrae]